jgi:hypothetical protein
MAMTSPSVEGPDFFRHVQIAEDKTRRLAEAGWDFGAVPELFGRTAACDVIAKDMVLIHDGHVQTRYGQLYLAGVGDRFNLMGPEHARAIFRTDAHRMVDEVNRQLGGSLLEDVDEVTRYGRPQRAELFNLTNFFQPRDLVFYTALHEYGLYPSGFENLLRHFAAGKIVHNMEFMPSIASSREDRPVMMTISPLHMEFPTPTLEWMEKPLYGGIAKETWHVETILTTQPTKLSHPYLELVGEGRLELCGRRYYMRRFHGKTQKEGVRGPKVPPERAKNK